jgi:hypothetical protein
MKGVNLTDSTFAYVTKYPQYNNMLVKIKMPTNFCVGWG